MNSGARRWITSRCVTATVLCTMGSAASGAEPLFIPAAADARIIVIANIPGYMESNYGMDILSVYHFPGNEQRTLLYFDLAPVAPVSGQRLQSAILRLTASTGFGGNPSGQPMTVWRVVRPWVESELTWLRAAAGVPWTTPGGDRVGPFSVSTANPQGGQAVTWDVTELVDLWLEGILPNHGMLLQSEAGNGLTFQQSEVPPADLRPLLILEFASGVPRLKVELNPATGSADLSWRDDSAAALQERADVGSPGEWNDSPAPVQQVDGRRLVSVVPDANARYFRLRAASAGTPLEQP